jgi:hypothetical protein
MPKEYLTLQLLRNIIQLWDVSLYLEAGFSLEEAKVESIEASATFLDEDVVDFVRDILDEVRVWVQGKK